MTRSDDPGRRVTATALRRMLRDGGELALLDVREEGAFATGHPLLATSLPLSRLELRLAALVPRLHTRIVLIDDDDGGLADRAARRLAAFGYTDVAVLGGGVAAWRAAGYPLFGGMHVPSKAFGEVVEHEAGTPSIEPRELARLLEARADLVVLDSRPMDEFRVMAIPAARNVPGGELVYRIRDLAPSPDTLVVVNCAGRTRSIIGAQSLRNAGTPNRVVALRNGTMGWHLAGLPLACGRAETYGPVSRGAAAWACEAAAGVAHRAGVRRLDGEGLARLAREAEARTVYLLDVRSPEEYAAGHLPGARSAPGGQLVQATDAYLGTRHARVVLVDDDGARALMAGSWLAQMGWTEVYVLEGALGLVPLVVGPERDVSLGLDGPDPERLDARELAARLADRDAPAVVDLATSRDYRDGHVPGAWFAVRSRLASSLPALPAGPVVLTCPDGRLARLAAPEAASALGRPVRVLTGGTAAWRAEGLPLATGLERMLDPPTDVWYKPYQRDVGAEEGMRDYLAWEVDLVARLAEDGDACFRVLRS